MEEALAFDLMTVELEYIISDWPYCNRIYDEETNQLIYMQDGLTKDMVS